VASSTLACEAPLIETVAAATLSWPSGGPPFGRRALLLFAAVPSSDGIHRTERQCSRPGCAERAEVSLTYQYRQSCAWLDELPADRDPHAYDLCARHVVTLSVPLGWKLVDRRHPRLRLLEPTGTDRF
jgi:Protein of unknown function (DUF3499)